MTKTKEHRVSLRLNQEEYNDLTLGLKAYADEIKAERDRASERSELAGLAQLLPHVES
ncbi:MAG: hypothetical protein HS113_24200 [Verrucomicrobiales bacterium]|nr:hypothetical protein [Verrucomicrobiales bacterium]